jgi:hypothetical protein
MRVVVSTIYFCFVETPTDGVDRIVSPPAFMDVCVDALSRLSGPKVSEFGSFLFDPGVSACAIAPIGLDFLLEEFRDIIGSVRRT